MSHHEHMNHDGMNHDGMDHGAMNHDAMDHAAMGHDTHSMMGSDPAPGMMAEPDIELIMQHPVDHGSHVLSHDDMMKMYFYFGYENVQMLLKNWQINTPVQLLWSCLILVLITLFHEWLRVWRENQSIKLIAGFHNQYEVTSRDDEEEGNSTPPSPSTSDEPLVTRKLANSYKEGLTSKTHIILSLSYVLQQFISLCLMLLFMTYNMYICLTITLSAGLGYYLFAWQRVVLRNQIANTTVNADCH